MKLSQLERSDGVTGESGSLTVYSRSDQGGTAVNERDHTRDEATKAYAEQLRRLRERRGLSKQKLADLMAYDRSYVSHIESGKMAPTESFTRQADEVLNTSGALWEKWQALLEERAGPSLTDPPPPDRELRTVDFVAWLADSLSVDFQDVYRSVAARADQLDQEAAPARHARLHSRSSVTRADLASALGTYYGLADNEPGLYRARVDGQDLTLSLLVEPEWLDAAVQLRTEQEQISYQPTKGSPVGFDDVMARGAIARLAEVEVAGTVMVNSPIYRLASLDFGAQRLNAQVVLSDYASYALSSDLMELELVDAVAASDSLVSGSPLPLRDSCMPSIDKAKDLETRHGAGGPASLLAIARPARNGRPPDYALLIQERSGRVLNAAGKLAVIPKAFHQPIGEPSEEALLSATLIREFEEELLGRQDLEQLSADSWRRVDPLHAEHRSEPLAWLLEQPDETFRTECTGFGINLVTGTYEFACLIVIEDETWWKQWGHTVEANWEAMRVHSYSSRDTEALAALATDQRWSNEGLFAFLEGLRRLDELDTAGRVAVPAIELLEG